MTPIEIPNSQSSFSLEKPQVQTSKVIIFLPGISGEVYSERFEPFVNAAMEMGFVVARINAWKNGKDVGQKKLTDIQQDMTHVINYLKEKGYESIFGVGKSFGATVLLTLSFWDLKKQVLWTPVVGIRDQGSNVDTYLSNPLGELDSLQDMYVDQAYMEKKNISTLIIHGDADENISISNSEKLVSIMPNAQIISIKGADHSYSGREHEAKLIKITLEFLNKAD